MNKDPVKLHTRFFTATTLAAKSKKAARKGDPLRN